MENALYDADLAQHLVNRLHAKSKLIVVKYTLVSAILFSAAFYFAPSFGYSFGLVPIKLLGIGLLIGVVLGFALGQRKSHKMKLAVQLALCQLQIEKSLRSLTRAH